LTDPQTTFPAKREAAANLATLNERGRLQTTIEPTVIGTEPSRKPNPAVAKFTRPTAAEGILAAMDADLKAHDVQPPKDVADDHDHERQAIEASYLEALVGLGDQRIATELAKRAVTAKAVRSRRQWAEAAYYLGDPKQLHSYIEDFRAGKVVLPDGQSADTELGSIVGALIRVGTAEAERSLDALSDPKHPQHKAAIQQLLTHRMHNLDGGPWFAHPYCLQILRTALDDATPTGAHYRIEKGELWRTEKGGGSGGPVPEFLADPAGASIGTWIWTPGCRSSCPTSSLWTAPHSTPM
jgi:hypothetical protein